jgi:hypothetical protein
MRRENTSSCRAHQEKHHYTGPRVTRPDKTLTKIIINQQ